MILSILQEQLLCLSLWWDFCSRVWFQEIFSFICNTLLLFFSFISTCLMVSTSKYYYDCYYCEFSSHWMLYICVHLFNKAKLSKYLYRCQWCNGYRRRKCTRWHEFKSWTRLVAFHIALIPLGKVWIQLFSLQLLINSRAD